MKWLIFLFSACGIVSAAPDFAFVAVDDQSLRLKEGNRPVFVYNHGRIHNEGSGGQPRSSYLHPIHGLDGEILTDDFPKDHYHHRGLFWAWPYVRIGEEEFDLWMLKKIGHRFEHWLAREITNDRAVLGVENSWVTGDRKLVREQIWFHVSKTSPEGQFIDVELNWVSLDKPMTLRGAAGKSYGGLNLRFAPREETTITALGSENGKDRVMAKMPWADLSGKFTGASTASGAAIFVHPKHPDYPPEWMTRHYGILSVGWPGVEAKTFQPGEKVQCRYRIWIHRGSPNEQEIQKMYEKYFRIEASAK